MNNPAPPFLELRDAVVRRAARDILSVESLVLPEGESVALLGPNGSGKSTLISLITREAFPLHRDEPPVLFRGRERATLEEVRACLGIVSSTMQDQITVHLPAVDVVVGGLFGALGVPRRFSVTEQQRQRAYDVMDKLGIADLAPRDIMTLSTGQARRVLIARSLVHDPDVLVLDEPCTGLDPEGMYYVRRTMRALAQGGRAIILVTHYPEDIIPEINRLVLIKDGRVFGDGTKRELLTGERMSTLFDVPLEVVESGGCYALVSRYE
ncbi:MULTISPECIES: ABC transporter ATP-binding protein [unclassified Adlercreutzia]|uniref:ABC transporter ATP-binding protein n=1 Tax=unclassified Adlercreutzia TaxID=2636013 RepID=UPI0013ED276D|nr:MULTISPECIES: ATP-binding cassette domain-containing protein [unclassified Adlercreutzia]